MGGCFIILVFLLILGAAIWLVELVVRTPALAIAIAVIAVLAFVGWVRSLNTPAARQRREGNPSSARRTKAGRAVEGRG
jgi:O-antigen ligase